MKKIKVKPASRSVKDILGRPYPESGKVVDKTVFVTRLLNEGALIDMDKKVEVVAKKKKKGDE